MSYFCINQIKKINAYPFTISSMIDKFYVDEELEAILKSGKSSCKIENLRVMFDKILNDIRPITFINSKKDEELKDFIEQNSIYSQILNRDSKRSSDSYLYDYENLDLLNTKQSFFQDGKSFNSFIKSKYLYFKNSSFYKNISKDEDTPEEIIKVIHNKLKSEELKNILEAYNGIKNTNLQEYIIFSKNTLYMLCAPRLNIDEATQEELEQIVWNINSKDILAYNGKTNIQHNIKEEKVYKTVFNAYIKDNQTIETSANTSAVFDEDKMRISEIGFKNGKV